MQNYLHEIIGSLAHTKMNNCIVYITTRKESWIERRVKLNQNDLSNKDARLLNAIMQAWCPNILKTTCWKTSSFSNIRFSFIYITCSFELKNYNNYNNNVVTVVVLVRQIEAGGGEAMVDLNWKGMRCETTLKFQSHHSHNLTQ